MIRRRASRHIAAPPARIWPLIDAVERHREWDPRTIRGERLDPFLPGRTEVGRRDRLWSHLAGAEIESDLVVTEYAECRRIAWRITAFRVEGRAYDKVAAATQVLELDPSGEDTEVAYSIQYETRGLAQSLVSRLGGGFEQRQIDEALERLAAAAEGGGGPAEGAIYPLRPRAGRRRLRVIGVMVGAGVGVFLGMLVSELLL